MFLRSVVLSVLVLACAACSFSGLNQDPETVFPDPEAYAFTDKVVAAIRKHDAEALLPLIHPDIMEEDDPIGYLQPFVDVIPDQADLEITRYYAENRVGEGEFAGVPVYMSVFDVVGDGVFGRLILAVSENEGVCCVTTYWAYLPTEMRPSSANQFALSGKSWLHYLVFTLLIGVPVFIIVTTIACVRNKYVKLKWAWVPFILVGVWGITFNWTTGAIQNELFFSTPDGMRFSLFQIHILGAGFYKMGVFAPWIIQIGTPLGAMLYWLIAVPAARKRRLAALAAPSYAFEAEDDPPPAA